MSSNIVIVVLIASMANAALYRERVGEKPAKFRDRPGCYLASQDEVIPFGKVMSYSDCVLIECTPEFIEYTTCGIVHTDDPRCHVYKPRNKMIDFPDCCPQIKCDTRM